MNSLLKKYDVPAPRYTSYPTVPYWSDNPSWEEWVEALQFALQPQSSSWSMYIHIPFCETLCSFCGCNTVITKSHSKEIPYIEKVLKEWQAYKNAVPQFKTKPIREIHLGGGTPTFLNADALRALLQPMLDDLVIDDQHFSASIEVDPRRTSIEQMKVLYSLGFRRISLGVQDFNLEVQQKMNRIQSYEQNEAITLGARDIGFTSVNFDLIYGLPLQTLERMKKTMDCTLQLRPDRIALYSLAIVPWIKPAQRLFKMEDLPTAEEKYQLYAYSRERLVEAGYIDIGMDHFALPTDELTKAMENGRLHRNFMGYTETRTDVLLGLGVSAISEAPTCFHQNKKELPVYEREVMEGKVPTLRGHKLTKEDQKVREKILDFMTSYQVSIDDADELKKIIQRLQPLIEDELVAVDGNKITQTLKGKPFLRNTAMTLDRRMLSKQPDKQTFSKSV